MLSLLDGAVLVVSAVEGVQAQTRVLMRALQRLGIPTVIFVNKTDRVGADVERAVRGLALAEVRGLGQDRRWRGCAARRADVVAARPGARHRRATRRDRIQDRPRSIRREDRLHARSRGNRRTRDRLPFGKVTAIRLFEDGSDVRAKRLEAGRIGKLWGLTDARIGDTIGEAQAAQQFAPPTLETVVVPAAGTDRGALHVALTHLAEQDPLINLRDSTLSLYGEVQKEVIGATLADDFGVEVAFRESTPICIEKPAARGRRSRSSTKARTRSWRRSGCASSPARASSSGSRSNSGRCRPRSSPRSRRPCARRSRAGGSPTSP